MSAELFAVGLNHKGAAVELREQLAIGESEHGDVLRIIKDRAQCSELLVVSTCNRVEVYGVGPDPTGISEVMPTLADTRDLPRKHLEGTLFRRTSADAARHIFRVAASLESLVVGEPQILGQVKEALARARQSGAVGPVLDRCLSLAFKCAKRVRTETEIARGGASVPSVAVDLARSIFGELSGSAVLVVGAGEMAEQAAVHLTAAGASEIVVVNRSSDRGQRLADQVGGHYRAWEQLDAQLARADIVVGSTGSRLPIIDRKRLRPIMKQRRHRPLFFVDIAVPRDIEPKVTKLENVYLYNVDDLQNIVHDNMRSRIGEADRADAIVDEELQGFVAWMRSRAIGPLMGQLQAHGREVVAGELAKASGKLDGLTPAQTKAVEQVARGVMQKLLHKPMTNVRKATSEALGGFDGPALAEALQVLFELRGEAARAGEGAAEERSGLALARADDSDDDDGRAVG